jgi:hypothetical protein
VRAAELGGPVLAGLAVAAYAAALGRYGVFDLPDEGLLLVQAWRAAHGQAPYVDFHTGYGPLYFDLQALLVRAGGMAAVRGVLALVHGVAAGLLYACVRRLAGAWLAAVAVVLEVAFFLPVAPQQGAPMNVPYPAWYAGVAAVALAVLLLHPGGGARAAIAGAVAGAIVAVKPNSGLLLAAGAAAALALGTRAGSGPSGWMARLVSVLLVLAALALVAPDGPSVALAVLVPPVVGLAARGAGLAPRLTRP